MLRPSCGTGWRSRRRRCSPRCRSARSPTGRARRARPGRPDRRRRTRSQPPSRRGSTISARTSSSSPADRGREDEVRRRSPASSPGDVYADAARRPGHDRGGAAQLHVSPSRVQSYTITPRMFSPSRIASYPSFTPSSVYVLVTRPSRSSWPSRYRLEQLRDVGARVAGAEQRPDDLLLHQREVEQADGRPTSRAPGGCWSPRPGPAWRSAPAPRRARHRTRRPSS